MLEEHIEKRLGDGFVLEVGSLWRRSHIEVIAYAQQHVSHPARDSAINSGVRGPLARNEHAAVPMLHDRRVQSGLPEGLDHGRSLKLVHVGDSRLRLTAALLFLTCTKHS